MSPEVEFKKQPKVEVDDRCSVTLIVTLDERPDALWHEYLGDTPVQDGRTAKEFYDLDSSQNTVRLTVKDRLVDLGVEQPHGVTKALDWLTAAIKDVNKRREERRQCQEKMQRAAEDHLSQWWMDYIQGLGSR